MMLEDVLAHIHNRFEIAARSGSWTIADGELDVPEGYLSTAQYYWVEGSVFNDGLHRHPADDLKDEEFEGRVLALAVPPALLALVEEMEAWVDGNSGTLASPYKSESFGGYSYTKEGGDASDGTTATGWQAHFRSRLNRWRKLA